MIADATTAHAATVAAAQAAAANSDHVQTLIAECTFGVLILGGLIRLTAKVTTVLNTLADHGKRLKSLEKGSNGGKVLPDSPKTV